MHVSHVELRQYAIAQTYGNQLSMIEAHLAGCPECVAGLVQEVQSLGPVPALILERLQQERRSGKPVSLQLLRPFAPGRVEAWIIDVSEGESKLMVHREVNPETVVQVSFEELVVLGTVEYYDSVDESYYLTVKFTVHNTS
jgi:hypothetical protein